MCPRFRSGGSETARFVRHPGQARIADLPVRSQSHPLSIPSARPQLHRATSDRVGGLS